MRKPTKKQIKRFVIFRTFNDEQNKMKVEVFSYYDQIEALTDYVEMKRNPEYFAVELLDEARMYQIFTAGLTAMLKEATGVKLKVANPQLF